MHAGDDDFTEVKAVTVVEPVAAAAEEPTAAAPVDEAELLSRLLSVTKAARNKLARSKSFSSSTALRKDLCTESLMSKMYNNNAGDFLSTFRMVKKSKKKKKSSRADAEFSGNESDGAVSMVADPQPAPAPPR